jgi:tetratricopeptide (TPR) repeat protein
MSTGYSRLWPVLVALTMLVGGAVVLEQAVAGGHVTRVVRITATAADDGDDDGDAEGGAGFAKTAPVDDGHAAARGLARRGEVAKAIASYREALLRHPDAVALHAELGFWLLTSGDAVGARAALERAAALDARDPWIQLNLGIAWSRAGKLADAERSYRAALTLRPGFGAAALALGTVQRRQGHLDDAIATLTAAAATGGNRDKARALVALARAHLAAKQRPAAARAIDRAIELAPADVDLRIAAGRAYLSSSKAEDTERAVALLGQAAELAPDVAAVFSALGRAKEKLGDRAGAEAAYARAVRLEPDHRYARRRLLRLALDRQDYPQARLAAEYLLARAPDEPEHHFLAGLVAARDERPDEARGHYRDAIARADGAYPEAYFNPGDRREERGRPRRGDRGLPASDRAAARLPAGVEQPRPRAGRGPSAPPRRRRRTARRSRSTTATPPRGSTSASCWPRPATRRRRSTRSSARSRPAPGTPTPSSR